MADTLRAQIQASLKEAMFAKDAKTVSTLRLVNAKLKEAEIACRTDGAGSSELGDDAVVQTMLTMVKQREDSVQQYTAANRQDLADAEAEEIAIIRRFLPTPMSEDEASAAIDAIVAEVGASSIKDMGKVMAEVKARYTGRIDSRWASTAIKQKLSA